jgi:hypothetical protein
MVMCGNRTSTTYGGADDESNVDLVAVISLEDAQLLRLQRGDEDGNVERDAYGLADVARQGEPPLSAQSLHTIGEECLYTRMMRV